MCDGCDMDVVILNLPHYLRCEAACFFLSHGVHVYVEKPMAITMEQCETMMKVSEECGRRLMVGLCLRFANEYKYLKNIKSSERHCFFGTFAIYE